jgi:hypothetical protein
MNKAQIWLGVVALFAGLVTGGLGSAAIGSAMYNKLDNEFTTHVDYQYKQDVHNADRLARIEEKLQSHTEALEDQTTVLKDIRDALRR